MRLLFICREIKDVRALRALSYVLAALFILLWAYYQFWFLRIPDRKVPNDNTQFSSPANGIVGCVQYWNADTIRILKEKYGAVDVWTRDVDTTGWLIGIVMDPTNVHFQRCPVDAQVISKKKTPGSFNNAVNNDNPYQLRFENEHNEILFQATNGSRFKTVQIAGFVARRIEDFVTPAQQLKQGEVYGLIKLGSQVAVILGSGYQPNVKPGETVTDGETVLATAKP